MQLTIALLAAFLPSLALTATPVQKPLQEKAKGWLNAVQEKMPKVPGLTGIPKPHNPHPTLAHPIKEAASKIAAANVHTLTRQNYHSLLDPDPASTSPTEWLIFITGNTTSCAGRVNGCHNMFVAWNESAAILSADPLAPKLGLLDCDDQRVLCAAWAAKPPTIWHIRRPGHGRSLEGREDGASEVRINYLNYTTTTAGDMVALHTGNKYKEGYLYEGYQQPFDSWLAKSGILDLAGYVLFAVGLVPGWALMLTISMVTRLFV